MISKNMKEEYTKFANKKTEPIVLLLKDKYLSIYIVINI